MKRYWVLAAWLVGCGSPPETPTKAAATASADGPEQQCLEKAGVADAPPEDAPTRISVSHIVVKHIDVATAADDITRSRGAACLRAVEALDKLKGGAEFADVVAEYSDEDGAKTRAGSLGEIKADAVAPSFSTVAFGLDVGQVSYVVESKFGFHIILRND